MSHFIAQNQGYIIWIVIIVFVIGIAWGVRKALKAEAVFFYNYWDLLANLIILAVFLGGYFNQNETWAIYAIIVSPFIAILYNFIMAFKFNDGLLALCIGMGRIVLGYIIPLLMIASMVFGSPDRRQGETAEAYELRRGIEKLEKMAWLGGLMFFLKSLVNGESVEYNRKIREQLGSIDKKFEDLMGMQDEQAYQESYVDDNTVQEEAKCPYEVLGVSKESTQQEIRAAFKKKSLENHPDRTGGLDEEFKQLAEKKMKEINAAYDKLRNKY